MTIFTTRNDLRNWVDDALGCDGTQQIIENVTDKLQAMDHPHWGTDWSEWLEPLDLWEISEEPVA